jgi:hypothetical protein
MNRCKDSTRFLEDRFLHILRVEMTDYVGWYRRANSDDNHCSLLSFRQTCLEKSLIFFRIDLMKKHSNFSGTIATSQIKTKRVISTTTPFDNQNRKLRRKTYCFTI